MTDYSSVKTIIFDYDGTLHDSSRIYIPAFLKAYDYLVEEGQAKETSWSEESITKWLGYSKKQMWQEFMPTLEAQYQEKASSIIGQTMQQKIENDEAVLYPHALDTLDYLKNKGYTLLFLSNCSIDYMEKHADKFNLNEYFTALYCTEQYEFKKTKKEIVQLIREDYNDDFLVIGDRFQDIEVAELKNISSIGCAYGYGRKSELEQSDLMINDIKELMSLL
ncbi:hypothetical protein GCM10008929_21880 [Alkalibacterium psychrotolerans]